ncbi:DNA repair protein RecO [Vulgatibacter incomptus]|uniref:DNA repair protein RecO n=1 Tax=Vulgatibacter incomptus TaxID=1391653 RepID=A0A0K1P8U2_9BACT|nr:DNA repair protein RecO [Vulgatibacter incomptus]AKU89940.1 DNA recombination and repair protein RecO [Vulgatibacter incomptus]
MNERSSEAIVLGSVDYGESDRIVTFLTRDRGRLSAFAAGARKSKRRFAGVLEPFTRLEVRLQERRGELLFLASCSLHDGHAGLREDLGRIAHAGHAAELCRELCRDREPHEELFDLLAVYLRALCGEPARPEDLLAFELAALRHAGVSPRFTDCALCGAGADGGALFDPAHGGIVCGACAGQAQPGSIRADAQTLEAVRALQAAGPFAGVAVDDPRTRRAASGLVRSFTREIVGKPLRSLDFLAQVGLEA